MTEISTEIRKNILVAAEKNLRRAMSTAAWELEYLSLQFDVLPQELFSIYIDVFSDPKTCSVVGVDDFVRGLFNDFNKLSEMQKNFLKNLFQINAELFELPMLRLAIGDLIARKYPFEVAIEIFLNMSKQPNEKAHEIASSGVHILSLRKNLTSAQQTYLKKLVKHENSWREV